MFFRNYPLLVHINEQNQQILIRNIMRRADILGRTKDGNELYIEYDVKDGEMPEHIANRIYGDSNLHWLILMMNNIGLLHCDWVKPYSQVVREAENKYGASGLYDVHHYEDGIGNIVPDDYPNAVPISNLDYDVSENEKKRRIKVLNSQYVDIAEEEIKTILKQ